MGLSTAISELKRLLDIDSGPQTDPLLDKLKTIGARGRSGATVTRLAIQPDMSSVSVDQRSGSAKEHGGFCSALAMPRFAPMTSRMMRAKTSRKTLR